MKYTESLGKGIFVFVFCCFFLREKRKIAVWNEINLMGQCGIDYEKFLFSDVQKTLCSSFQYFYFP